MSKFILFCISFFFTSTLLATTSVEDYRLQVDHIALERGKGRATVHIFLTNSYEFILVIPKYEDIQETFFQLEDELSSGTPVYLESNCHQSCLKISSEYSLEKYDVFLAEKTKALLPKIVNVEEVYTGFFPRLEKFEIGLDDGSVWHPKCGYSARKDVVENWQVGHSVLLSSVSDKIVRAIYVDLLHSKLDTIEIMMEAVEDP